MSQAADAWIEIIQQLFREFNTVDMTGGEPSSRPQLNKLYPELRMALMDRATRDEDHSHLYRQAGITLLVIDLDQPPSREALTDLRTALSTAARLTAQRPMRQETKFSLLKRIAAAKTVCQGIADGIPADEGAKPSLEVWREKELEAPTEPAAVRPVAPPAVREPEPAAIPKKPVPVQAGERIEFVDILRGFALIGVLVANMSAFSGRPRDINAFHGLDYIVDFLITFLVEAKFYSLFSLLFGWGMAMQMTRAEARGTKFVPVYLRRLLILLAFGIIHGALIWTGDILTMYALLGFLLLLLHKLPKKLILAGVGLMLLLGIARAVPGEAMDSVRTWCDTIPACIRSDSDLSENLYATGTFSEIARLRFQDYRRGFWWLPCYIGNVFAMFLLGLYIGKRRIFQNVQRHLPLLRRVVWVGLVIGVVFNGIFVSAVAWPAWVPTEYWRVIAVGARTIGAPALMLFYVSGIILLLQKKKWQESLAPLASVGRSALSNYLLQSVVCTLIFYNYGLGLYGEMGAAFGLVLSAIIFVIQIRLSDWWFDSHQFGPVESLWRVLTYGRLRPSRPGDEEAPSRVRTIRQVAARVPTIAWVGLGLVLLIVMGLVGSWMIHRPEESTTQALQGSVETTLTPVAAQESGQLSTSSADLTVTVTPEVRPVAYNPGPIAASGDLTALAATFSAEEAYTHIERLTGPPYLGRYAGTAGGWAAGDYLAEQFARYGLQPAGDDGTFFQSFAIAPAALAEEPTLVVEGPDGTVYDRFRPYQDFTALAGWYSGSGSAAGAVVWANSCAHDDFDGLDVAGQVVLCRSAGGAASQAEPLENAGRNALEHGAIGLLLLADPQQHPPHSGVARRQTWVPEPIPTLRIYPSVATKLLLESGKTVTDLALQYTSFPLHTRVRMEVKTVETGLCPAEACQGRNVLGVIPGRDPALADQVLIIGAHYDQLGESPSGLAWTGANDNTSGVAVLLQIAQSWHEQGYVPRRTVLFAAWDAFELDQAGSQYYVAHPRYPLDNTIAVIQISAAGAGGDTLSIGGDEKSAERIRSIAEAMGHAAETGNTQTSDHRAFLRALVPACVLSWSSADNPAPYRNQPEDTPEIIDLDKLRTSGQIADIALLGLTEGEPAISDLLAQRAEAILERDLDTFLATSLPEQEALDKLWFADAQSFSPNSFEMEASEVEILGGTATAVVKMTLTYPREGQTDQTLTKKTTQEVRFVHGEDGWQWAGPNLVPAEPDGGFAVMHPPGTIGLDGLGQLAAEQYAQVATWLGLPPMADATLLLFPGAESLRASTALSVLPDENGWVGPGRIKLVYSPEISTSLKLSDALVQLLLAEAGVTESAAPWLWQGLPLIIQGKEDPTRTQLQYLRSLRQELAEGNAPSTRPASWAAVDYLQRQIGWQGIGHLITDLGQACQEGLCKNHEGADLALLDAINMDTTTFAAAWQADWQERLAQAQANLDAVLAVRQEAALAGDEAAFLDTVEPGVPHLVTEEQHWLVDLIGRSVEHLALTGEPLALLEDGSILADVTLRYALGDSADQWSEGQVPLTILFTPGSDGYRWAGPLLAVAQGDQISVHYPEGQDELAQAILDEAETIYTQLAAELGVEEPETLPIKLYDNHNAFRTSIFLSFPLTNWISGWTGAEESVKLRLDTGAPSEAYRPALAVQLARRLLYQMGVETEWLVHGASIYLSRDHDGGRTEQSAASSLDVLAREIGKGNLADLSSMPPLYQLSEEGFALASAQAWDVVRYLVTIHGREALTDLLQSLAQGTDLETALRRVTGQSLPQFESAWAESAVQAHTAPGWIDTALAFDPESAHERVVYLASPELAGRQAGSPGAETAAAYIAELFASYGLIPAGESDTYFQSFPVSYTTYLDLPQLEILDLGGQVLATMPFRDEFLPLFNEASNKADMEAELVWVPDTYQGLDLSGKVVLCRPSDGISENISQAIEHGASGVIVVGDSENRKEYLSKQPIPIRYPADDAVPVLELTQNGYEHLLEATGLTPPILLNSPPALPLGFRARIKLPISTPTSVQTANVLGLLPGADPVLGQEIVILSAHYDHVGDDPGGRRYSGANDDASGIAVLLEIARLWHERGYHPQRSVLFVAWSAQELGMIGSRYYIEHALFPLDKTVAVLQLDAVGGGGGHYMEVQGFREQEGLLMFNMQVAEDLVDGRLKLAAPGALDQPVETESERVLYASPWEGLSSMLLNTQPSDQAVFHQLGISAVLVNWRGANEDNWPDEIADEVEPYRLGVTGRMVTLVLMTVAGE